MATVWEVYTYGGGEYLSQMFTALKLFIGSSSFTTLARLAGVLGVLWIMMQGIGPRPVPPDWGYFMRFGFVWLALIVPKVDVAIVDRLNPVSNAPVVVDGVPLGVGALAGLVSSVGDGLAQAYETYISIPGDQKYAQYGMLFGSAILRGTNDLRFTNATFAQNMSAFLQNCAFPLVARGEISDTDFENAGDLWALFSTNAPSNRYMEYKTSVSTMTLSCDVAATYLNNLMPGQEDQGALALARALFPGVPDANAKAIILGSTGTSYQNLAGISRSSSDIIRQGMMINAVRSALSNTPPSDAATGMAVAYAQASAEQAQKTSYLVMGNVAAKTIPIMRSVLEAVIYGVFPVVAVFMLLPVGFSALGQYLIGLAWIQMWPLLYAILNSIMYWYGKGQNSGLSVLSSGVRDYAVGNAAALFSVNTDIVAMAGYMTISIPMIAYMLVRGGAMIGSTVASSLMQPAQAAAQSEASQAAKGNYSMGNMAVDTTSYNTLQANKWNDNVEHRSGNVMTQAANGAMITRTADGSTVIDQGGATSSLRSSINFSSAVSREARAAYEQSIQAAGSELREYGQSVSATLSQFTQSGVHRGTGARGSQDSSVSWGSEYASAASEARKLGQDFARKHNLTEEQAYQLALSAKAGFSIKVLGASGEFKSLSNEKLQAAYEDAQTSGFAQAFDQKMAIVNKFSNDNRFSTFDEKGRDAAKGIRGALDESRQHAERVSASLTRAERASQMDSEASSNAVGVNTNMSQAFVAWAQAKHQLSAEQINRLDELSVRRMQQDFAREYVQVELGGPLRYDGLEKRVEQAHADNQRDVPGETSVRSAGAAFQEKGLSLGPSLNGGPSSAPRQAAANNWNINAGQVGSAQADLTKQHAEIGGSTGERMKEGPRAGETARANSVVRNTGEAVSGLGQPGSAGERAAGDFLRKVGFMPEPEPARPKFRPSGQARSQ